jgi:hypothetical protein
MSRVSPDRSGWPSPQPAPEAGPDLTRVAPAASSVPDPPAGHLTLDLALGLDVLVDLLA